MIYAFRKKGVRILGSCNHRVKAYVLKKLEYPQRMHVGSFRLTEEQCPGAEHVLHHINWGKVVLESRGWRASRRNQTNSIFGDDISLF